MKLVAGLFAVLGTVAAFQTVPIGPPPVSVVIVGGHDGYLAPCGCTSPMTGGLLRQAAKVRALSQPGGVVLDTGDLVTGNSRQDVLKAETLAEALPAMGVAAANITVLDAKLGLGEWLSLSSLGKGIFSSGSIASDTASFWNPQIRAGRLLVMGATADPTRLAAGLEAKPRDLTASVEDLLTQAKQQDLIPVVLLDGDARAAADLAIKFPDLRLVTYRSTGSPSSTLRKVGAVALVSPGEHGQFVVHVAIGAGDPSGYTASKLGPEIKDDPDVSRFYKTYLRRIESEQLWANTPRQPGGAFVGSEKCGSCHQKAYAVWKVSQHSLALRTLEAKGHGKDPECLPCHITGPAFANGYRSRFLTPQLAAVSCESCHGGGAAHTARPKAVSLPKLTPNVCTSCHALLNSPKFAFAPYWARIKH